MCRGQILSGLSLSLQAKPAIEEFEVLARSFVFGVVLRLRLSASPGLRCRHFYDVCLELWPAYSRRSDFGECGPTRLSGHPNRHLPPPYPGAQPINVYTLAAVCFVAVFLSDLVVYSIGRFGGVRVKNSRRLNRFLPPGAMLKAEM